MGSLLADLCPVNDTVDFPVSLLLFLITDVSINLPENGYEIGKASWPPGGRNFFCRVCIRGLNGSVSSRPAFNQGLSPVSQGRGIAPNIDLNRSPLFST